MANILDTSLALGSVPYNFAKGIIGNLSNPGATTQVSLTNAQKNYLDNIAKSKGTSGTIDYSDYGSPTKTFSGISGMNPMEVSLATTMGGTGYTTNPDGSINYTGGAYDFGHGSNNFVTNFINKGGIIGAADSLGKNIYDKFNEDDPYAGIKGHTAFLDPISLLMTGSKILGPGYALKSGGNKELAKYKIRKDITDKGWAKTKEILAAKAAAEAAAKAKADAAAKYTAPRHHQDVSRNRGDHTAPTFRNIKDEGPGVTASSGMHGGKHYADGGLINFYRYGGFI